LRHAFVVQDVHDGLGAVASDVEIEDADDDRGLLGIDHAAGADHLMVFVQDGLAQISEDASAGGETAANLPEHAAPGLIDQVIEEGLVLPRQHRGHELACASR
jgi:hypothetical protein